MDDNLTTALRAETDAALRLAGRRLDGLTDDEFLREPVERCWTVRRSGEALPGAVPATGEFAVDGLFTFPDAPPFTTIAWRLNHMTLVMSGYANLVGASLGDVPVCATALRAVEWWTFTALAFREAVFAMTESSVRGLVLVPHWGREAQRWTIALNVLREQVHHGAEIGVLRDLYRAL